VGPLTTSEKATEREERRMQATVEYLSCTDDARMAHATAPRTPHSTRYRPTVVPEQGTRRWESTPEGNQRGKGHRRKGAQGDRGTGGKNKWAGTEGMSPHRGLQETFPWVMAQYNVVMNSKTH